MLIHQTSPVYPHMGDIRIQGAVVLAALIDKEGNVERLHIVSTASPLLNQAALDAAKQWKYRPYLVNGQPVEVDTRITVNFVFPASPAEGAKAQ